MVRKVTRLPFGIQVFGIQIVTVDCLSITVTGFVVKSFFLDDAGLVPSHQSASQCRLQRGRLPGHADQNFKTSRRKCFDATENSGTHLKKLACFNENFKA